MTVIAEGVETAEQLTYLQSLHCDEVQGYFLAKPMPVEELSLIFSEDLSV
ncbi:diguanylate cyclase [Yersinia similis]|nr:diguanylate cyclase [Yersinia similis]